MVLNSPMMKGSGSDEDSGIGMGDLRRRTVVVSEEVVPPIDEQSEGEDGSVHWLTVMVQRLLVLR
jgi:hypothetical protein